MVDFKYLNTEEGREEIRQKRIKKMLEEERLEKLQQITCCFTVHRPDKLPGKYLYFKQNIYIMLD